MLYPPHQHSINMNKSEHGGTCKAERVGNRTEETVLTDVQTPLRRLVDSY